MANPNPEGAWWGQVHAPEFGVCEWQIGPLRLLIQRLAAEWRIAKERAEDPLSEEVSACVHQTSDLDLMAFEELSRFGADGGASDVELVPALADRALVSIPQRPFFVPAEQSVTIFLSSPLWVQVVVGSLLEEFAIVQPGDTWFGPNTQVGEVCYASRSFCRLERESLPLLPHRATTSVVVKNRAKSALLLERMKLPVPYLSLYASQNSSDLWTNDVVLEHGEGGGDAPLEIVAGPPRALADAVEVGVPRKHHAGNIMVRAFETLFSERGAP